MKFTNHYRYCHAEPFASLRVNSAKELSGRAPRSFPFAPLRASAHALRMTTYDRTWLGKIIIGGRRDKSAPTVLRMIVLISIIYIGVSLRSSFMLNNAWALRGDLNRVRSATC